jgi:hypothetical protein
MSCSCDCDAPSAYWAETRQARKAHTCSECAGSINPGERYRHVRGVWNREPSMVKTCSACLDLETWVEEVADCRPCHGELVESASEELRHMNGPKTPELRRLWWRGARLYALASRRVLAAKEARRLRKAEASAAEQAP